MSAYVLDVDGQPVRVCGTQGPPCAELQVALAELARAARAMVAEQPELCRQKRPGHHLPCLEDAGHEGLHRTGTGATW